MGKEKINSVFDHKVVDILKCIVPDQKMTLNDGEGNRWESHAKQTEDGLAIVVIKKNDDIVARVVYDYDSSKEEVFLAEKQ